MKIDGKQIAAEILADLKVRVEKLKQKNIFPTLYVILLSDDKASASYINQKQKRADEIGAKIILDRENAQITTEELIEKIKRLITDEKIHGIIVQRPMPAQIDGEKISQAVDPKKDIDGFNLQSKFQTPVAAAVWKILEATHRENFDIWIKTQKIAVLGRGITAGGPIIRLLQDKGLSPNIITSKTENPKEILTNSDVIISAVGKKDVFTTNEIKKGAIVIGVGMHVEEDGKFKADFNDDEIAKIASFYSPTPGGVGPVNVSILMSNLVSAAENL